MTLQLSFGYNAAIPDDAIAAWGARFIITQDGYVDFVPDRTDAVGDTEKLFPMLEATYPLDRLRGDISDKLRLGEIHTREAKEIIFFDNGEVLVVGNSNASAGYFYVACVLRPHQEPQTYRLEIRWDFTGTLWEARREAQRVANIAGGEVTDIMDENWESV